MGTEVKVQRVERFESHPSQYRHWSLAVDGPVATLTLHIDEANGLRDDYELKLNSYDLGVDIELQDAVDRLSFEHPAVTAVVVTSGLPRIFSAGANIKMLASSTHGFKVNFCRYTNETRAHVEEACRRGQRWIAACNGTASGGGYELALACETIALIDDGSSAVSLPEVPLLGVLPGTGGLTRLVDKRRVRRDVADVFCTKAEGFRARDAKRFGLVDETFSRSKWEEGVAALAARAAAEGRPGPAEGVSFLALDVQVEPDGARRYSSVDLALDPERRVATITVRAPAEPPPADAAALRAAGLGTWSARAFRELEDALLHLRFNHDALGVVLLRTEGDPAAALAHDAALHALRGDWLADRILALQARVLRRVDNTAKSFFALVDAGSCFAGTLFELALAADRTYMLDDPDAGPTVRVTAASAGLHPMSTGMSRLAARFVGDPAQVDVVLGLGEDLSAADALDHGLVTLAPDDLDWEDEIRIAIEERASLSPDALTGMEQNLRFVGAEGCDTKIFGRLSAWQNWIFQRPNAVGERGALTLYGHPERPVFDWRRT